jgi:hypothetical protein
VPGESFERLGKPIFHRVGNDSLDLESEPEDEPIEFTMACRGYRPNGLPRELAQEGEEKEGFFNTGCRRDCDTCDWAREEASTVSNMITLALYIIPIGRGR